MPPGETHIPREATLVVAASDSLTPSADYVCDGTNDQATIQAAITALPASGGSICLLEGHFLLGGNLLLNKPVRWVGSGPGTVVDGTNAIQIRIQSDDVEIANIKFHLDTPTAQITRFIEARNGGGSIATKRVNIHDCIFIGKVLSGHDYPDTQADSTIGKCIETGEATDWIIHHNFFKNIGFEAVSAGVDLAAVPEHPTRIIVTNNTYDGGKGLAAFECGTDHSVCSDNVVKARLGDNTGCGVFLYYNVLDNVVSGNTIDCQQFGVAISGAGKGTSSGNLVKGNNIISGQGIDISTNSRYNRIIDNTIVATYRYGIEIIDANTEDNEIIGNRITAYELYGISIATRQSIRDNHIRNCGSRGISLAAGCPGSHVIGNLIDAAPNAIFILHANNTDSSLITHIENNVIQDTSARDTTTLDGAFAAGVDVIKVANASVFEIFQFIQTQPTGFAAENNRIISIDYYLKELTLESVLANNHLNGDPVVGRKVTTSAILEGATSDYNVIAGNKIQADIGDAPSVVAGHHTIWTEQRVDHFLNILAASTNHCGSWVGTGAEQVIVAGITQPDVPRNLTVTCTNNAAPSGDIVIEGVDAKGNSISEAITILPAGTRVGNQAFATISQITIPATVNGLGNDTVDVGIGSKLGLANIIHAAGDVYKVDKNAADYSGAANVTVDATYDTVDVSTGGAIVGGDDFTIWYRSNLNIQV